MNISNISTFSTILPFMDRAQNQGQDVPGVQAEGDVVHVRPAARLLEDGEWEDVLGETMGMIAANPLEALHVHSGLDPARVAALLA